MMIHNEPGPALSRHIGPNPLHEDANAKTGLRQELQMDSRPSEARQESADVDLAALENGKTLTDHRHVALIEVTKWRRRGFAGNTPVNQLARIPPLLHRYLRYARQRLTILIERCSIADHEDFRVPWHSE